MFESVNWEVLTALSGSLFLSMSVLKPTVYRVTKSFNFTEDIQKLTMLFVAIIGGILIVALSGDKVSIVAGTKFHDLHPLMSTIATGFSVAMGSKFLHWLETLAGAITTAFNQSDTKPE